MLSRRAEPIELPAELVERERARTAPFGAIVGPTGVLLVHGFGGSPAELRPLGTALIRAGYSVRAPLLPGHGAMPDDLARVGWREWVRCAAAELHALQAHCPQVFVVGFSMGGLVALLVAAHRPVAGVVAIAPALVLRGQRLINLVGAARHVTPWFYPLARADFSDPQLRAAVRERAPDVDLDDPQTVATLRQVVRVPLAAVEQILRLQQRSRRDLGRIGVPALVLQGGADATVDPRGAYEVERRIGSPDVQLRLFPGADHQLITGEQGASACQTVLEWLAGVRG